MTTPTTQPDRCEQIARDLLREWKSSQPEITFTAGPLWSKLEADISSAIQAAKRQGREEGEARIIKNSIDLLGRGCERHVEIIRKQSFAEFRENYPACQWCLAEEVRTLQLKASQPTLPQPQTPHQ